MSGSLSRFSSYELAYELSDVLGYKPGEGVIHNLGIRLYLKIEGFRPLLLHASAQAVF